MTKTDNYGLNIFVETDKVDFDDINENFEKIDKLVTVKNVTNSTKTYSGYRSGNVTWRVETSSDNSVEMFTSFTLSDVLLDRKLTDSSYMPTQVGDTATSITVNFPVTLTTLWNVNLGIQVPGVDTTEYNIVNTTANSDTRLSKVTFRMFSTKAEPSVVTKRIYIYVKGVK